MSTTRNQNQQKLIEQVQKSAQFERGLYLPPGQRTHRSWPVCMKCGQEVDAAEIKHINHESFTIWARHQHIGDNKDSEDWMKILFPFRIEGDPTQDDDAQMVMKLALNAFTAFDPSRPTK